MELTNLINNVSAIQVTGEIQRKDVSGIFYDSRKVIKNSIFVAIKGYKTDGHLHILDAINKGAIGIILENNNAVPDDIFTHNKIAKILVQNSRAALADISGSFYKKPSEILKLIGITGTNGKTTTTYFIKNILEAAGEKVGLIGTIANYIGSRELKSSLTTPEANDLNEMLYEMVREKCSYAVMEVSSHSLSLKRVYGLHFSSAVFTNISSDHLDFHLNFENYFLAKKKLFDSLASGSFGIINSDDEWGFEIVKDSRANLFSYGTSTKSDFAIKDIKYDLNGTSFTINHKNNFWPVTTSLIGTFNAYNACSAFAASYLHGVAEEKILEGIKTTKQVPGRFEVIKGKRKKVIIDYSHTADSLVKALTAIHAIVKNEVPVYTVFGCGGDRDKTKRPVMGKIAADMSYKVIITSDNPRFEDPYAVINDIKTGITKKNFTIIENREEAIKSAIQNSEEDAVILIAGKGHENYQEIKGVRTHFSDKEIAGKYLIE
jgi:UDP-N-acetylmuramoyl-L-alanyl-D-glutamate--2,6-diaminopimelate ligase